jgi:NitT/TauT family transport system permease protein
MANLTGIRHLLPHFHIEHNKSKGKFTLRLFLNLMALLIITSVFIFITWGAKEMTDPISNLKSDPINLDPGNLLAYSLRTMLRMLIAVIFSLLFTFIYASLAAKNHLFEKILVPLLDILQSVPILGYISFTVTAFLALFPGSMMGAECAAIFAIFTSQAWNMTFSFYRSLKSIPEDLESAASIFKMSSWQKFWRVEVPYGVPSLVWNMVVSMSGGWFFVVASEVITVGNNKITLPGIGSYIALALEQKNILAIFYAIIAMILVIILYDQLLLRPLVAWADKFKYEMTIGGKAPKSWVLSLFQKNLIIKKLFLPINYIVRFILYTPLLNGQFSNKDMNMTKFRGAKDSSDLWINYLFYAIIFIVLLLAGYYLFNFLHSFIGWHEVGRVFILASITLLRVVVLIVLASIFWVPIGVYIGQNPRLSEIAQPVTQFLAAFPINLLFPVVFIIITHYKLNANIWLSPLMIMGTQWYILFNVIAGSAAFPNDLKEITKNLNIKGWLWWRKIMLPAIVPYFITGAITASGGAWNASILAEVITYGNNKIVATGIGSYIAEMTVNADFHRIILGIFMMSLFVVFLNRFFWQPLYDFSNKRFQL